MLQLAEDIMAGLEITEAGEYPWASLNVVQYENEIETLVATVRAIKKEQVQLSIDWHDVSYKDNVVAEKLVKQAQSEVIMFVVFGGN
jgi:hypothetical protein